MPIIYLYDYDDYFKKDLPVNLIAAIAWTGPEWTAFGSAWLFAVDRSRSFELSLANTSDSFGFQPRGRKVQQGMKYL